MSYMKDSTGRRLDSIAIPGKSEVAAVLTSTGATVDQTTAINTALATGSAYGTRKTVRLIGDFKISAPLVIGSNTFLDARDATVTLAAGSNCNILQTAAYTAARTVADVTTTAASTTVTSSTAAFTVGDVGKPVTLFGPATTTLGNRLDTTIASVTNATTAVLAAAPTATLTNAAMSVGTRNTNIEIQGGTWIRAAGNGTASVLTNNSFQLRRVDGLKVHGYRFQTSDGKYAISLADVTDALIDDGYFISTASDGVHVNGPAQRVTVRRQRGTVGDDLVAFTTNDTAAGYGTITDTVGPISDISIDECFVSGLANAAATPHAAVVYGDCGGTYPTARITIRNCADLVTTAQRSVSLQGALTEATIQDCKGQVSITSQPAAGGTVTPQTQSGIRVRGHHLDPVSGGATSAVFITSTIVTDITIEGLTLGTLAAGVTAYALLIGPASTVTRATLHGITRFSGSGARLFYAYGAGTAVADLAISDSRVDGVDYSNSRIIVVDTNATLAKAFLTNVRGANLGVAFVISGSTLDLHVVASVISAVSNLAASSSTVRFHTWANDWGSGNVSNTSSALRSVGDLLIDVSLLGKTNGDQAFNTNAALACGLGPVVTDGTTWRPLQGFTQKGTVTLTAGAATVARTATTANTQIRLTIQAPGGTVGTPYVNTKTAGTGFTIASTSSADTSVVLWEVIGD